MMAQVTCLECGAEVEVNSDVMLGEILQCPDCGVELEITALEPVQIELAPEIEEDWGE